MEPVTHVLTGACLARAGCHRKAAYATVAMAIAAELPDIDTVWSLRGPVTGFEHHRGITHTFIGIPVEACILVAAIWAVDRWRGQRSDRVRGVHLAPVRWDLLFGFTLLALLSHILLDYTNNYGVRPFFPFNPQWYAGSFVFIFDPLLFLLLVAGLLIPVLFGLIGQEVSGKRESYRGTGWARAALLGVALLYCFRAYEHKQALALAGLQTLRAPEGTSHADTGSSAPDMMSADRTGPAPVTKRALLQPLKALASPDPFNPFQWYTVTDFGPAYQVGVADARRGSFEQGRILNKAEPTPALLAAERSSLGRVYLDWSPMPWVTMASAQGGADPVRGDAAVIRVLFRDPRFMGASFLNRGRMPPLSGTVDVDAEGRVVEERFGERVQR